MASDGSWRSGISEHQDELQKSGLDKAGGIISSTRTFEELPAQLPSDMRRLIIEHPGRITFDPLVNCTALCKISLKSCSLISLAGMENLTGLKDLLLENIAIADPSLVPLASLPQLTKLEIAGSFVTSLEAISRLSRLLFLNLGESLVSSLSPLSALHTLQELSFHNNCISSLEPLVHLSHLQSLKITGYEGNNSKNLTSLQPLSVITTLRTLTCFDLPIMSLEPIASLPNLSRLFVNRCLVSSIEPLSRLTDLAILDCRCYSPSLAPLANLTRLRALRFPHNGVTSLDPLSRLTNLSALLVESNSISSLEALSPLTKLALLYIDNNPITSLQPLSTLTRLRTLVAGGMPMTKFPTSLLQSNTNVRCYASDEGVDELKKQAGSHLRIINGGKEKLR